MGYISGAELRLHRGDFLCPALLSLADDGKEGREGRGLRGGSRVGVIGSRWFGGGQVICLEFTFWLLLLTYMLVGP